MLCVCVCVSELHHVLMSTSHIFTRIDSLPPPARAHAQLSWVRTARTDKGVHAAANVISFKVMLPPGVTLEEARTSLNAALPPAVRVHGLVRTGAPAGIVFELHVPARSCVGHPLFSRASVCVCVCVCPCVCLCVCVRAVVELACCGM